jgi:hypothetical protein
LAFNFNNDPSTARPAADPFAPPGLPERRDGVPPGDEARGVTAAAAAHTAAEAPTVAPTPVTSDHPQSAALVRFNSCRWQQPAEEGNSAFCTHREVKPYAGTTGFDADAWCPDCQYYKLRRAPKKRTPSDDYSY